MEVTLGDFVKYLVLLLHQGGVPFSFRIPEPWHTLFYKLKNMPHVAGKPDFFGNLGFDWDGPYPKSEELTEFIRALCLTGSVVTTSPHFDAYALPEETKKLWLESFEKLDEPTKRFLTTAFKVARGFNFRNEALPWQLYD
ncbi:MAG: hypothetical protein HYW89_01730 [Candidatus Sungiibacteriota bacterium]|uniref:Uncharacterized protein n=1 Tax=Candidatus Sungiibacteriota bacterium TaxID=2750080 RepID=A0A7T5RK52_9BACT|nr:MAG: hypothetical protein HYW89_01730 [Candidatus Sungbacteria bacterium]